MKKIAVLSGAGVSAESGLATFRDSGGLWEGHDVMEVASPQGWAANPDLVNNFYNLRRRDLLAAKPNAAHEFFAGLEEKYSVTIITQNVDDLHERAGSSNVVHLHGELFSVRSSRYDDLIYPWKKDLSLTDVCEKGHQLRPNIVWFGEAVPEIPRAVAIVEKADIVVIVGTSMQVYPAAGLVEYAQPTSRIIYIDPNPASINRLPTEDFHVIAKPATGALGELSRLLGD